MELFSTDERKRINHYFPYVFPEGHSEIIASAYFILAYPKDKIIHGFASEETGQKLQAIINFTRDVTGLDPKHYGSRIIIGYRRDEDLDPREGNPSWVPDNTIKLPWGYLQCSDQPIEACTHELVHLFFHMSELHKDEKAQNWGEVFCDFLRIKVSEHLEFEKDFVKKWLAELGAEKGDWKQHGKALRLLAEFKREYGDKGVAKENLRQFIQLLFENPKTFHKKIAEEITQEEKIELINLLSQ